MRFVKSEDTNTFECGAYSIIYQNGQWLLYRGNVCLGAFRTFGAATAEAEKAGGMDKDTFLEKVETELKVLQEIEPAPGVDKVMPTLAIIKNIIKLRERKEITEDIFRNLLLTEYIEEEWIESLDRNLSLMSEREMDEKLSEIERRGYDE